MFRPGDKIEEFVVVKILGSGGFGSVYEVEKEGKTYAIKVLDKSIANAERRFKHEFETLKSCQHQAIIKVYSDGEVASPSGEVKKYPYIVMDKIEGMDLGKYMAKTERGMDIKLATEIIFQIAQGLEYVHHKKIIHRDIQPKNIIYDPKIGRAVLVDFGSVKDFNEVDYGITFSGVGTRRYSSHHKTTNPRNPSYSDDIWSLGAIYYFLLTKKHAFHAEDEEILRENIKQLKYEKIHSIHPDIPNEVVNIVEKMIGGETSRYLNCRCLILELEQLDDFRQLRNMIFISKDIRKDNISVYQMLVNKIYGSINYKRSAEEIFQKLVSSMGKTNSLLVDAGNVNDIAEYLSRSFIWLCSFSLKIGIDLESSVWLKFPNSCPYCLKQHNSSNSCTKETKGTIDLWYLRKIANQRVEEKPTDIREWEKMFSIIYPTSSKESLEYLSKKLIEELGEVADALTKPKIRWETLKKTGIDPLAFELADIFAWMCQCSVSIRPEEMQEEESVLVNMVYKRLRFELCPFCHNPICTCDLELEAKNYYKYIDSDKEVESE